MSDEVIITGWGAVSPAGWNAGLLADAVLEQKSLPVTEERRTPEAPLRKFRAVPPMPESPPWLRHARLRRASPAARYAVGAALEALRGAAPGEGETLGVVFVTMNGSVTFSRRFFAEVLENPALASPILFPETVFNAPASHLGTVLGSAAMNYTLLGDSAQFLRGLDVAVEWLIERRVSKCLVVAAEELDWLSNEALLLFPGRRIAAEGAAAMCLQLASGDAAGPRLEMITEAMLMGSGQTRAQAAMKMRAALGEHPAKAGAVLCDSRHGSPAWDAAESRAFGDCNLAAHSAARWLGDGFGVAAGWQSALACELLHRHAADSAIVSAVGCSQQAIAAVLAR